MASCRGLGSRSITLRGLLELAPILQLCQLALWPPILLKRAPIKSRMVTVICSISALAALCGLKSDISRGLGMGWTGRASAPNGFR